jgi:hypothetical protein
LRKKRSRLRRTGNIRKEIKKNRRSRNKKRLKRREEVEFEEK